MRAWMLWLALAMSAPAAADEMAEINAVSRAWDRYAQASSENREDSVELLSDAALAHYGFLRDVALHASPAQIRRIPVSERLLVYLLRAEHTPKALAALDVAGVARLCYGRGWAGVGRSGAGGSLPALNRVTLLAADHALGELGPPTGNSYVWGPELVRERGAWKVLPQTLALADSQAMSQHIAASGADEDGFVAFMLTRLLKHEVPPLALLDQPPRDDGDARSRLNETWPAYEATYATRAQALRIKAEADDPLAQLLLGGLLASGSMPKVIAQDKARGLRLLEQASDGGNVRAAELAAMLMASERPAQLDAAWMARFVGHTRRAAEGGAIGPMGLLGAMYFTGAGPLRQDCVQAEAWAARAEDAGGGNGRNDRVWYLAACPIAAQRDPPRALRLAAPMLARGDALPAGELDTLAAAMAANRRFDEAVRYQQRALQNLDPSDGDALRQRMQARLQRYRQRQDWVEDFNPFAVPMP